MTRTKNLEPASQFIPSMTGSTGGTTGSSMMSGPSIAPPRARPATRRRPAAERISGERLERDLSGRVLPLVEQIRERAYFIYLSRGGENGDPVADWLQAEREVLGQRHA